jgi:hypothetical protein
MEHFEESKRLVRSTAGTLKLAIATGRREQEQRGAVSADVWTTIDALADELVWRLGLLEAAERAAGLREPIDAGRFARVFGLIPPDPRRA